MQAYSDFEEIQTNLLSNNLENQMLALYCITDEFVQSLQSHMLPYITRPEYRHPPRKTFRIGLTGMVTVALFFPFSGQKNLFSYHKYLMTHF